MARKKKKPSWDEIKIEYATTDISYRGISQKYGIPHKTVAEAGKAQGFVQAREQHRAEVATKTMSVITDEKVNKLAGIARAAEKMSDVIETVMEDTEQFFRRIDLESGTEFVSKKVDSKAMKELTAAMKDLTAVIRDVWNIPTQAEDVNLQLARERLELEKKKAEALEEIDYSEFSGVVLIPPVLEEEDE